MKLAGALVLPDEYLAYDRNLNPFIRHIDCPTGEERRIIDCDYGSDSSDRCLPVQIRCDGKFLTCDCSQTPPPTLNHAAYPTDNCVNGSVRLADRRHPSEGMLELCLDNQWGTVCNNFFSDLEAQVVCRRLGFSPEGVVHCHLSYVQSMLVGILLESISYGEVRREGAVVHNPILMCTGSEGSLLDCESFPGDQCTTDQSIYMVCLSEFSI